MAVDKDVFLKKLIAMFRSYPHESFLGYAGSETICGPNDGALIGFDTNFPKAWLVREFGFSPEEADFFVKAVHSQEQT